MALAVVVLTVVEVELEADARGGACCCDAHAAIPGQLSARTTSNLTIGIVAPRRVERSRHVGGGCLKVLAAQEMKVLWPFGVVLSGDGVKPP
ncbi:hypothetical protein, partial [Mycobacterium innocens]|uniref:hypothetical protein n=1 Tax=Mycobacterium innocens TaxID=2341083 RepID=UPI001FC9F856